MPRSRMHDDVAMAAAAATQAASGGKPLPLWMLPAATTEPGSTLICPACEGRIMDSATSSVWIHAEFQAFWSCPATTQTPVPLWDDSGDCRISMGTWLLGGLVCSFVGLVLAL